MTEPGGCLTEYVSRSCRRALAKVCVEGIRDANPMSRISPTGILAAELGVSHRTVNRWLSGGIQGCDLNIERLIALSLRYSRADVEASLKEDLEAHRHAVDDALGSYESGGCPGSAAATRTIQDGEMINKQSIETGG
jgi:hypothetical protein